jgi:hypothetical protein
LESFIISQSDKKIREELESIKKERDAKWHKTNWPKHLRNIYESRKNE